MWQYSVVSWCGVLLPFCMTLKSANCAAEVLLQVLLLVLQVTVQAGDRWTAQVTAAIQALRMSTGRWQPWRSRETDCNPWASGSHC